MAKGDIYPKNRYRPESPELPFDTLFSNPPGDPLDTVSGLKSFVRTEVVRLDLHLERPFDGQAGKHEDVVGEQVKATRLTIRGFLVRESAFDLGMDFYKAGSTSLKMRDVREDVRVTLFNGTPVLISLRGLGRKILRVFSGESAVRVNLDYGVVQILGGSNRADCYLTEGEAVTVEGLRFSLCDDVFKIQPIKIDGLRREK